MVSVMELVEVRLDYGRLAAAERCVGRVLEVWYEVGIGFTR